MSTINANNLLLKRVILTLIESRYSDQVARRLSCSVDGVNVFFFLLKFFEHTKFREFFCDTFNRACFGLHHCLIVVENFAEVHLNEHFMELLYKLYQACYLFLFVRLAEGPILLFVRLNTLLIKLYDFLKSQSLLI